MAVAFGPLRRRDLRLQHRGWLGEIDPGRRHAARIDRVAPAGTLLVGPYRQSKVKVLSRSARARLQPRLHPYWICLRMCSAPERSALPSSGSMLSSFTTPSTTYIE